MKIVAGLCAGMNLLAVGTAVYAQSEAPPNTPVTPATEILDVVAVTGSRIVRNGYEAPTPVTVAPADQLDVMSPTSVSDALVKLPVFGGSTLQSTPSNASNISGNYLNLRSFGINRTLVLMDGLRVAPSNYSGQVDINAIPQMLLQRVDVVTGGASAVYGSDAVTGVVNFIMDTHFTGVKVMAQSGISARNDAPSTRYGIAAGTAFLDDRVHVVGSFEHFQQSGLTHDQRDVGLERPVYVGSGTASNPYTQVNYPTVPKTAFGGYVLTGPFAGQQFLNNGQLGTYTPGAPTASANISVGGDAAYYNHLPLYAPQETNQGYARAEYDLTDSIQAFIQGTATQTRNDLRSSNWPPQTVTLFSGNPFLPASAQAQLAAAGASSFTMNLVPRDLNLLSVQDQLSHDTSVTAGLTGKLSNFKWSASYSHGESSFHQSLTNNINVPDFLAALDAVKNPSGNTVCRVTLTNPGLYPGCAPIDMFGAGNESAAAEAFIFQTTRWQLVNTMDDYVASLSGSPFSNWAGPVSIALNGEYRNQGMKETTTANPLTPPITTGLLAARPSSVYAYATVAPNSASNNVREVSAESVVPLLSEMPYAKSLEVSGAIRYTDYSTSGSVDTWKIGLVYQPVDDVRFRATESRDIRAPTLYDLFAGQSTVIQNLNDPHTGVSKVTTITTRGNPNLVPEVALTKTAGIVYSPSWLPRFRTSVDYYDITINNAIISLAGNNPSVLSECEASGGTAPICELIVRPQPFSNSTPANFPTTIYQESLNVARNWTRGVDVEASYEADLSDIQRNLRGQAYARLLYSYQPTLKTQNYPGGIVSNAAGVAGLSAERLTLLLGYGVGPLQIDWQTRYLDPQDRTGTPGQFFANPPLRSYSTSALNIDFRLLSGGHSLDLFLDIQNVFDAQPRIASAPTLSGVPGSGVPVVPGDDLLGRYFTVGLRAKY